MAVQHKPRATDYRVRDYITDEVRLMEVIDIIPEEGIRVVDCETDLYVAIEEKHLTGWRRVIPAR